jgi:hypothetical protein
MGTVRVQREDNSRLSAVVVIGFQPLPRAPLEIILQAIPEMPSSRLKGLYTAFPGPAKGVVGNAKQFARDLCGRRFGVLAGLRDSPVMGFAAPVDAAVAAIPQALERQPHPRAAELPTQTGVCSTTSRETVGSRALRQQQNW